jgi:hypothetical protein
LVGPGQARVVVCGFLRVCVYRVCGGEAGATGICREGSTEQPLAKREDQHHRPSLFASRSA